MTKLAYRSCGLPVGVESLKLSGVPAGESLKKYLKSSDFSDDLRAGVGLCISGASKPRVRIFSALARALVDMNDSVYYMSIAQLSYALDRDDGVTAYSMARSLFLTGFYCNKSDCLLSATQRLSIMRYLEQRLESPTARLYLTVPTMLADSAKWWGSDFVSAIECRTREVSVGF